MRFAVPLLLLGSACAPVTSSIVRTANAVPVPEQAVAVQVTQEPADADQLGIVEAHASSPTNTLQQVLAEVIRQVAALGGDIARVDTFATRYEMITESYSYECGTTEIHQEPRTVWQTNPDGTMTTTTEYDTVTVYVSKTCTDERQAEAGTLTIEARAFRTRKGVQ